MNSTDSSNWVCPICKKPTTLGSPLFPFCSDRCRLVDLGRWLDGTYIDRVSDSLPPRVSADDVDDEM